MSSVTASALLPAAVLLRISLAVALTSGSLAGPSVEVYADALAGLQRLSPALDAHAIRVEAMSGRPVRGEGNRVAWTAALHRAEQLGGELADLARRAAEERVGRGIAFSGIEPVSGAVELDRVERTYPEAWAVLTAAPTTKKIVAMARVVSRPAA